MPKVKIGGKVKHFPYTKKGKIAAKKAKKVTQKKHKGMTGEEMLGKAMKSKKK